ncbi:MAG: PAAR domain-containing protein [Ignavibacterium sp.]|nr:PAAR domain-containing protein [Ignavibacterium sp.]
MIEGHPGDNPLTGSISSSSGNVFCNGLGVARVSDKTQESDPCGPGVGSVASGSGSVFCNGLSVARLTDKIAPHHGYANIISASGNVFVG